MKKKMILVLSTVIAISLFITACGSDKKDASDETDSKIELNKDSSGKAKSKAESEKRESNDVEEISVGLTIRDPELKYTINVNKILLHVTFNKDVADYNEDSEYILVELTGTNASDYSGSIYSTDFKLVLDNGSTASESPFDVSDYAKEKGFTLMSDSPIKRGDTATVWIAFKVDRNSTDDLRLRYDRPEADIIGGGSIPAHREEVDLN